MWKKTSATGGTVSHLGCRPPTRYGSSQRRHSMRQRPAFRPLRHRCPRTHNGALQRLVLRGDRHPHHALHHAPIKGGSSSGRTSARPEMPRKQKPPETARRPVLQVPGGEGPRTLPKSATKYQERSASAPRQPRRPRTTLQQSFTRPQKATLAAQVPHGSRNRRWRPLRLHLPGNQPLRGSQRWRQEQRS